MRKGWRGAWIVGGFVLLGTPAPAARNDPITKEPPVRLAVEIDWSLPNLPALPSAPGPPIVTLCMTEGRVVEALDWPHPTLGGTAPESDGSWRLGTGRSGRVRGRIEAPIGASLKIRADDQE